MGDEFLFTVCCPCCGTVIGKSFVGSRTFTHCSKCSADIFYETKKDGPNIKIIKGPKNLPKIPSASNE